MTTLDWCLNAEFSVGCMLFLKRFSFNSSTEIIYHAAWTRLERSFFLNDVVLKPKLGTYIQTEHGFVTECSVKANLTRTQTSLITQMRSGILPLALEAGRFKNIPEEQRLAGLCDLGEVESESHFLLQCPFNDWLKSMLWWMKCILKILKWFGAPMTTGWNGCLISTLTHPGRNVRVFYFFCMSTVICLVVCLIVSWETLIIYFFTFDTMKKVIKIGKKINPIQLESTFDTTNV